MSNCKSLAHIFHNQDFCPVMHIRAFKCWLDKGMYGIGHFFTSAGPISLSHCIKHLDLPDSEQFRFKQISHYLHSIWLTKPNPPQFTPYEQWCGQVMEPRGGISIIYSSIAKTILKPPYMIAWEADLQENWDLDTWYRAFFRSYKVSSTPPYRKPV